MDEEKRKNIQEYINIISYRTGKPCEVNFDGILAVVKHDSQIIFTSAGMGNLNVNAVEAFLGGIAYGLNQ